ncbi:NUDIX hydrolase [archaeon]|nr:NUDIX hydrolase [archaeon]
MKVINGIIFEKGKVLLVKKKDKWILPGGKLENELYFHCLEREFSEELSETKIDVGEFYDTFSGITPFSKKYFEADVYFCTLLSDLGKPSQEILDRKYFGKEDIKEIELSKVTRDIFNRLVKEGYVK